jgi:stage IV sporulation protein FA
MEVRKNVRQRRRARIRQLTGLKSDSWWQHPAGLPIAEELGREPDPSAPDPPQAEGPQPPAEALRQAESPRREMNDPEQWWKERQRQLAGGRTWGVPGRGSDDGLPPLWPESFRAFARGTAIRCAIALLLLAAAWGGLSLNVPGSDRFRLWAVQAVTQDMDFSAVEAWYARTFGGSPSFLPVFRHSSDAKSVSADWDRETTVSPVAGRIVQSFAQSGTGVRLAAPSGSVVRAVHAGRVMQVTGSGPEGSTVLVQHANRVVTIYGNVDQAEVKPNDWVEAGQALGRVRGAGDGRGEGTLYFAVKQNGKTLDPADVIAFD